MTIRRSRRAPAVLAVLLPVLLAALLAGCVPVPGAGWDASGDAPGATAPAPAPGPDPAPDPSPGPDPGPPPCIEPLAGDVAELPGVADLATLGTLTVLHLDRESARSLTSGPAAGPDREERGGSPALCRDPIPPGIEHVASLTLAAARAALEGLPLTAPPRTQRSATAASAPPSPGADAVLGLAEAVLERTGTVRLVLTLDTDLLSLADLVAHVRDGVVPVALPSEPAAAPGAEPGAEPDAGRDADPLADLLAELRAAADLTDGMDLAWAASSSTHARALTVLLDAAGTEHTDTAQPDTGRPERWHAPVRTGAAEVWLGDVRDVDTALQAAVAAATRGAAFVAVDGTDLRSGAERTGWLRAATGSAADAATGGAPDAATTVVLVGDVEEHTGWQLATVLAGTPLPGGGFLPLEDRRIVALYGSPGTSALGLLGAQDAEATIVRAREVAERYADAADGREVVPGLDVIATIASRNAEPTGDYSRRVPIEQLRPLVDLARDAGMAVFLDLQPGRTDFLTQAREYVELLREPHVHLALDPEWRIGPRERHLVRIGSVEAAEVQEVADWLAALVRDERLPQKVLMLHQFTLGMLPDRDTVVIPPELVGVIHVDGQGSQGAKDATYARLSTGAPGHWEWGWKNFTRIDVPVATPERSLARTPVPVVVTYQ